MYCRSIGVNIFCSCGRVTRGRYYRVRFEFKVTMFFSHEILQRKSALGQIWIAATMGISRINRRKVQGIDVIQVCSQILEPVTPLALRLSGILMGKYTSRVSTLVESCDFI
ncbi:hypothetical protein CBR_g34518 [Chara braunii]|uniref:Rad21/Rec8-like protein N-terminal domain-containing protein n=1 Tax=Chara braunii TaxID=69332 RepID=A0A388LJ22_CHABU|nr:hypothetical protein CBR_g34518 [Chara braunii]|eukprot:GBG82235.1 hypothetical protein CBR_g34518 [Chara braunii]